ncbi:hypothetical protein ACRN98_00225 [Shewanella oncorhynchi]|jgi:hypothetical protein|nr:hypothetical protein [Shewanella sp. SM69]MCU8037037.1 hypothetical protein [Shewanella sp. SM69]
MGSLATHTQFTPELIQSQSQCMPCEEVIYDVDIVAKDRTLFVAAP